MTEPRPSPRKTTTYMGAASRSNTVELAFPDAGSVATQLAAATRQFFDHDEVAARTPLQEGRFCVGGAISIVLSVHRETPFLPNKRQRRS